MNGFKRYMGEDADVRKTLAKIPPAHRSLVDGYKVTFEPDNTLRGDDKHVGVIMTHPHKQIRVASPWNYGRGFAFLHEVGHLVYEKYVRGTPREAEWARVVKSVENRKKEEPAEENFSHAYAATYSKYPPAIHHHPEWVAFIKQLPS